MSSNDGLGWVGKTILAGVAAGAMTLCPSSARAEGPATPDGKGIAGGILLGGEVVMLTMAIIGIEEVWPYPVFGAVGAGAGAVGGWGIEQTGSAEGALYFLAGGMALIVPTLVAVLNATAYDPETDEGLDDGVLPEEEADEPGVEGEVKLETQARRRVPPAFVGVDQAGLALGVPAVEVRPVYSPREQVQYGLDAATEIRVPVVHGTF
ncbi:MAG: hypothetical protein JRI23_02345 [Deltaproteobacteria bacterium]|jgi:hypothetical protein|nr:hypothetical protein [Deltaproteobacteria bacterium]MBW2530321.1 hypothetical protein [Deltaproteobacteria bacterium]